MQIDKGGIACDLCVAVRHRDNRGFLQAEDIAEILGPVFEECQFRRAWVAKDRRYSERAKQFHCRGSYCDLCVVHFTFVSLYSRIKKGNSSFLSKSCSSLRGKVRSEKGKLHFTFNHM